MCFRKLIWPGQPQHSAFYSTSDLDLANIKKTDVGAKIKGYIEIQPGVRPQSVRLFLEVPGDLWYYLSYSGTQLQMLSSDPEFNQIIASKSEKSKPGNLSVESTDLGEAQNFIDRFRRDYLKTSEPEIINIQADREEENRRGELRGMLNID